MSGLDQVRRSVAALSYAELETFAHHLARRGDRADEKRLIAVLAGWSGWEPPRPARVDPFRKPERVA